MKFKGYTIVKVIVTKHCNRKKQVYWLIKYKCANGRVQVEKKYMDGGTFPTI